MRNEVGRGRWWWWWWEGDPTHELKYVLQQVSYHSPQTSSKPPDQIEPKSKQISRLTTTEDDIPGIETPSRLRGMDRGGT